MKRTTAEGSSGGLYVDKDAGSGTAGTKRVAEDANNNQEEICNVIEGLGLTLDGANQSQLRQAIVGLSHGVGELVLTELPQTIGVYWPAVDRSADIDIAAANYPLLVPALRARKASVLGVTDHTVSVSGTSVTFPDTTAANRLLTALANEANVANWLNLGQTAASAAGYDYATATSRHCINIAGTDYNYTGINLSTRVVTMASAPPSGSQTAIVYPYRIAGSTTTARLLKLSGSAAIVAGDADGEIIEGLRKLDQVQGHRHAPPGATYVGGPGSRDLTSGTGNYSPFTTTGDPVADPTNGTPRTGKTTDPRSIGMHAYTWAGIYVA